MVPPENGLASEALRELVPEWRLVSPLPDLSQHSLLRRRRGL